MLGKPTLRNRTQPRLWEKQATRVRHHARCWRSQPFKSLLRCHAVSVGFNPILPKGTERLTGQAACPKSRP